MRDAFGAATNMPLRARDFHPEAVNCPLHLQRICGVCRHFDGPDLTRKGEGRCTKKRAIASNRRRAKHCTDFERKMAGV